MRNDIKGAKISSKETNMSIMAVDYLFLKFILLNLF